MARQHSPTDDLQDLRAVLASTGASAHERLVMMAFLLHRNGDSGRCDPSVVGLAEETGLARRTVLRTIGALEGRGWIRASRSPGLRTQYALHPPTGATQSPVSESHRCQTDTGVVSESHRSGATQSPERTKERTKERTDTVSDLWPVFVEEMDGDRLTRTRRKKLAALHREQLASEPDPVESFRRVLRAVKASEHHMSERAYQMPESLFRNEERRERWAEKARTNGAPADPLRMSAAELWETDR